MYLEAEPQRAVTGGEDRWRDQRQRADRDTADGGRQPDGDSAFAKQFLGDRDTAHDGDTEQGAEHTESEDRDVVERLDVAGNLRAQVEDRAPQCLDHGL